MCVYEDDFADASKKSASVSQGNVRHSDVVRLSVIGSIGSLGS